MPYYQAAGEKLIEAKAQMKHGEFIPWVKRNFNIGKGQASLYMALAEATEQKSGAPNFSSLREFERETGRRAEGATSWTEPVKQIVARVDTETLNLKREEMKRQEERDAQRKLAIPEPMDDAPAVSGRVTVVPWRFRSAPVSGCKPRASRGEPILVSWWAVWGSNPGHPA
jgi:hypothetical protein